MCVAQKRLCLSSLICLKGVVSYTQATVPQLHHLACRFFLLLLWFFSSLFAFSSFLPVGFFILASPSYVMHQSIPPAPCLPPPPGYCGPFARLVSTEGGAFANFTLPGGSGICQHQGNSRAFDTHAVSYQNITTQKVLLEKTQIEIGSSVKDRNKLKRVVKACSRLYACISSLLIKIT